MEDLMRTLTIGLWELALKTPIERHFIYMMLGNLGY